MSLSIKNFVFVILFVVISHSGFSQETKAEKWTKIQWYEMVLLKFKAEKRTVADEFIKKNFIPVDKELGRKVISFDIPYGDWDQVVYFPLDNLDELNYKVAPSGLRWMSTFVKQQGGQDKATKLLQEFESFVDKSQSALVKQSE